MSNRDSLVDDILKEISANRGVPYEKRTDTAGREKDSLVDEILAESVYKTLPKIIETVPTTKPVEAPRQEEIPAKPAKKRRKEEVDLLSTITPWEERHAAKRGLSKDETAGIEPEKGSRVEDMTGVKNTRDFFTSLKKTVKASAGTGEELLYKKGGAIHPKVEDQPAHPAGTLQDVSTGQWQATVAQATRRLEDTYEPTRAVVAPKSSAAADSTAPFASSVKIRPDEITGQVRLEGFDRSEEPAPPQDWENDFMSGRQDKVKQFKMNKPATEEPDLPLTHEEDGEYHSLRDASPIKYDLLARRRNVTVRLWGTGLLAVMALLLTLVNTVDLTNGLLGDNPILLLGLYGGVLLIAAILNFRVLWGGFVSLFTGSDQDSPAALAMTVAFLQAVTMAATVSSLPADFSGMLVGAPALLAVLLNLLGKRSMFTRLYRNMELIGNEREKWAVTKVAGREEAFELGRGLAVGVPEVAFGRKEVNLKDFIYHSYAPDRAELSARLPVLLSPLFGLMGGLFAFFFLPHTGLVQGVLQGVSGFCCGICVALPFTVLLSGNLPLGRFSRKLFNRKIMLSGYDAVEEFKDTDVLALDAAALFPAGSISLKSIKSATNQSLDRSIMDVAGVVCMADSPLKPLFETIIQGKTKLLPEVDTLVYEEEMGISGWVMGYRVLVGTKKLMENHGVLIPDTDFEEKYKTPGLRAVYLSTQGILSAVFLVQYTPDLQVMEALQQAVSAGLGLHIYSCDPNITREMICRMFYLPSGSVRIMGAVPRRLYKQQMEADSSAKAILSYEGDAGNLCRSIASVMKLNKVIRLAAILQTLLALLGGVLFLAFVYVLGGLSGGLILLYHLLAAVLILGLPLLLGR